jgi:hypothetical protein
MMTIGPGRNGRRHCCARVCLVFCVLDRCQGVHLALRSIRIIIRLPISVTHTSIQLTTTTMEELSFYFTVGCIVLVFISFLWMIQHDYHDERLSRHPNRRSKLVVVLLANAMATSSVARNKEPSHERAASSSAASYVDRLRHALESSNVQVLTVLLVGRKRVTGTVNAKRVHYVEIDKRMDAQLEQLVDGLGVRLQQHKLKFHAYIDLVKIQSLSAYKEAPPTATATNQSDELAAVSTALLMAFKRLLVDHKARIILVSDKRSAHHQTITSPLDKMKVAQRSCRDTLAHLVRHVQGKTIRAQLAGNSLVEISLVDKQGISIDKALIGAIRAALEWGEEVTYSKMSQTTASIKLDSSGHASADILANQTDIEDKLIETIRDLVLMLHPFGSNITIK